MSASATEATDPSGDPESLIAAARRGDAAALAKLLEGCRQYLLLVANRKLPADLQAKVGASDLVQDTWIEAHRDFVAFRGSTEAELLGWLRRILLHNLAHAIEGYRDTAKRDVGREVALGTTPHGGGSPGPVGSSPETPSHEAMARERDEALCRALERLPEVHRQVIQWHNYDRCPFEEIGQRLGRSAEAARKLWTRALEQLHHDLEGPHEPG